jgi:hypothetical protein
VKNKIFISLSIIFYFNNFLFLDLKSQINNYIVVKVGNEIITSSDVQNEIRTNIIIKKKEMSQENINEIKNLAIQSLIKNTIKGIEINKFGAQNYDKSELQNYIQRIADEFQTDKNGLKDLFKNNKIDYEKFEKMYETELMWNTLIFNIYKNQININIFEVENEIKEILNTEITEYNLSQIEIQNSDDSKNKINEILESIKKDGFELTAKKYSILNTADNGGLIGWVKSKSLSKKIYNQINELKVNEISKPIINENSITFLKLNDIKKIKEDESKKNKKKNTLGQEKTKIRYVF